MFCRGIDCGKKRPKSFFSSDIYGYECSYCIQKASHTGESVRSDMVRENRNMPESAARNPLVYLCSMMSLLCQSSSDVSHLLPVHSNVRMVVPVVLRFKNLQWNMNSFAGWGATDIYDGSKRRLSRICTGVCYHLDKLSSRLIKEIAKVSGRLFKIRCTVMSSFLLLLNVRSLWNLQSVCTYFCLFYALITWLNVKIEQDFKRTLKRDHWTNKARY